MDKTKHPGINFDSVILSELVFKRKPEIIQKPELDISFESNIAFNEEKDRLSHQLKCKVTEKNQSFNIECTMIGIFSINKKDPNMEIEVFADKNAPALIFPYIRAEISSLTAKAGIPSLLLPPINVYALLNQEKKGQ